MTNAEKVYMTRCLHGASSQFRDPKGVRGKSSEEMGGWTCRIRYPRRFYGGYHSVRGDYLSASGEGDVEGQAPGVIYNK